MKGNVLNFTAEAAVPAFRFAKAGSTEGNVKLAGAGEIALGATGELDTAEGCRCDVQLDGIAEVECGGSVTFGAKLASDANGKAVAAESGEYLGIALEGGASGDIIRVKLSGGYVAPAQAESSDSSETPAGGDNSNSGGDDSNAGETTGQGG